MKIYRLNNKGYIAPLAMALLVILAIIIIATFYQPVKQTIIDILSIIFGGGK